MLHTSFFEKIHKEKNIFIEICSFVKHVLSSFGRKKKQLSEIKHLPLHKKKSGYHKLFTTNIIGTH